MGCVEHSVQAEGGGRNVAWGVPGGWGLGIPPIMFKRGDHV